jgi:hypothetical protein
MAWSKKIETIISNGIALHDTGVNNWALSKKKALDALDKFESEKISVLGGDVYELTDGVPKSNYDNWYCEPQSDESFENFAARSVKIARDYVSNYSKLNQQQVLFVFSAE